MSRLEARNVMQSLRSGLGVELSEVSITEKLIATLGGGVAILALIAISRWAVPGAGSVAIIGSMGASAVLLFAVPHGQLSQPWPVIAGHGVSAAIGVLCAQCIALPMVATAVAVGLAIGVMYQFKCIHPPGGATAFAAVMGGSAIHDLGYRFIFFPVLANAVVMVLLAFLINAAFKWRRYPAVLGPVRRVPASAPTHAEVLAAVKSIDSFVDVNEADLIRLAALLSRHSHPVSRNHPVKSKNQ